MDSCDRKGTRSIMVKIYTASYVPCISKSVGDKVDWMKGAPLTPVSGVLSCVLGQRKKRNKNMIQISYTDGTIDGGYETTEAALAAIEAAYPDYWAGHDGDLADGGDRTLVWACEADSENDDGARAIASLELQS